MTTFHAEYDLPGSFFGEAVSRELPERSVAAAKAAAPKSAFAFTLFECPDPVDLGPEYRVIPKRQNVSGKHFLGGQIFTLEEIEALGRSEDSILLSNMRSNRWHRVIRTSMGNWQPFEETSCIV